MDDVVLPRTDTARRQLIQRRQRKQEQAAPGARSHRGSRTPRSGWRSRRSPDPGLRLAAGPLTEVCMTSVNRLSERRLRVLTPSLTAVVNHPPFFQAVKMSLSEHSRLKKKMMSKKADISTQTNLLFVASITWACRGQAGFGGGCGTNPTKGSSLITQAQAVLIWGLLAMTI